MRVHISGVYPINVDIQSLIEGISEEQILEAKEDVAVAVDMFEHLVRKNSLFFAWREGESVLPETVSNKGNKSLRRIFLETQVNDSKKSKIQRHAPGQPLQPTMPAQTV